MSRYSLAPGDYPLKVNERIHRNWSRLTKVGWSRIAGWPEGPVEVIWVKKPSFGTVFLFTTLPDRLVGEVSAGGRGAVAPRPPISFSRLFSYALTPAALTSPPPAIPPPKRPRCIATGRLTPVRGHLDRHPRRPAARGRRPRA